MGVIDLMLCRFVNIHLLNLLDGSPREVPLQSVPPLALAHHIRATLPDVKQRIATQLRKHHAELQSLGGVAGDKNSSSVVLVVITEFITESRNAIDRGDADDLSLDELSDGALISFVFHELLNNGIRSIDPFDQVKSGDIRTSLYNSSVIFPRAQGSGS